ncbi:MAG: phosphotransferase [Patescibacteria group bacterium]|jgi:Ser/Thr protein kinase RdoA (MazF antagonist)
MINKNTLSSFLNYYGLADAKSKLIESGLSSFVLVVVHKNKKYVLKIYDKKSNVETEAQFSDYLYDEGIPTAKIIKNSNNQLITAIGDLRGILFNFCDGDPIRWNNISPVFSKNLAKVLAKMHSLMPRNIKIPGKKYHGCKIKSSTNISNTKIIQKSKEIKKELETLNTSKLRTGLIHADLTRQNILVSKNRNKIEAIIDFGDAHYDYLVWDLSILITHIFITKTYGIDWKALSIFIKEYYSLFPLTKGEMKAIIPFIKIRNLNLAIEVNNLISNKSKNIKELKSIENSVLTKLELVSKNEEHLMELLIS